MGRMNRRPGRWGRPALLRLVLPGLVLLVFLGSPLVMLLRCPRSFLLLETPLPKAQQLFLLSPQLVLPMVFLRNKLRLGKALRRHVTDLGGRRRRSWRGVTDGLLCR